MGVSVLDMLVEAGAYERRAGSVPGASPLSAAALTPPAAARRAASPPSDPPPLTPGTHAEVRVVSVTSVSSLHVRPLETEPLLQQMLERLTDALNVSACALPMERASEGAICAAFKVGGAPRARGEAGGVGGAVIVMSSTFLILEKYFAHEGCSQELYLWQS